MCMCVSWHHHWPFLLGTNEVLTCSSFVCVGSFFGMNQWVCHKECLRNWMYLLLCKCITEVSELEGAWRSSSLPNSYTCCSSVFKLHPAVSAQQLSNLGLISFCERNLSCCLWRPQSLNFWLFLWPDPNVSPFNFPPLYPSSSALGPHIIRLAKPPPHRQQLTTSSVLPFDLFLIWEKIASSYSSL